MRVRKKHPGSSSHGHEWTEAGEVLDIPVEDAADCMRVAPEEFEVLPDEPEAPEQPPKDPDEDDPDGDKKPEDPEQVKEPVTEPEPEPVKDEPEAEPAEAKRPAARRGRRVTED